MYVEMGLRNISLKAREAKPQFNKSSTFVMPLFTFFDQIG